MSDVGMRWIFMIPAWQVDCVMSIVVYAGHATCWINKERQSGAWPTVV
jgi:hypothetical protein